MIPVDKACIDNAYRCPWTHKLFTVRQRYIDHLARYRENQIHEKIRIANWAQTRDQFNAMPDFYSVVKWIENNSIWFLSNGIRHYTCSTTVDIDIPSDFKIKVTNFSLEYSDKVSNSHSCPRDGVSNWNGNMPGVPNHYPGWYGRIYYLTSHDINGIGSDLFKGTGINTGSGGGSKNRRGYDVKLFASDWPVINSILSSDRCESLLKNERFASRWSYES